MKKTILVTGSTDGIGLTLASTLIEQGHRVLLHGRNQKKLDAAKQQLLQHDSNADIETYLADLSTLGEVKSLASEVQSRHSRLDVLINNAGVYVVPQVESTDGLDIRFVVNTIAPYLLTQCLLPLLGTDGRVVNVSSAAQAPLDCIELTRVSEESDSIVYAKSKLAIIMWTRHLASQQSGDGPMFVAVNPASLLASKMVKQAYGVAGASLQKGADVLAKAATSEDFSNASGLYFDNDSGQFSEPHTAAKDEQKNAQLVQQIDEIVTAYLK
ncbi:MAG: oxidoreductase [Cellvibrionaceae bacterium]|nr:oxidoreductase [Cellvibrionaceae bacterium]|tara:strand:+ start:14159 stop:14968 length:810 start_codon:yes stop_codon:yes gene_type:complete